MMLIEEEMMLIEEETAPAPAVYSLDTIFVENCEPQINNECLVDSSVANIRVRNLSLFEICNIEYIPYFNSYYFDDILPGQTTCYIPMDPAYRFPAVVFFRIRNRKDAVGSVDLLGEVPIPPGFYTFDLSILNLKNGDDTRGRFNNDIDQTIFLENNDEPCLANFEIDCPESIDTLNEINIRVANSSIFMMCNFRIIDSNRNITTYGNIRPNETTCYLPLPNITESEISMAFVVNGESILNQLIFPTDPGKYTLYTAVADLSGGSVYRFVKDE